MIEEKETMKKFWDGFYRWEDFCFLRDLIHEIMAKGYYPIIRGREIEPTVEKTGEFTITVTQPLGFKCVLVTAEELVNLGIDFPNYLEKIYRSLEEHEERLLEKS